MILSKAFTVGQPVALVRGRGGVPPVFRILAPNAGPMTGPGTNSYLLGRERLALIDPGPADPLHVENLRRAIGGRELGWVFVTHTHGDHSPACALLRQHYDPQFIGLAPPGRSVEETGFRPDRLFHDGEQIDCDGFSLQLIHTPGHVSNHLCLLLREEGMLFTGDHVLDGSTSVILPPDGDMGDYMESLARLQALELSSLAPGHGDLIPNPDAALRKLMRHRQRREKKVLAALRELGACTLDELTPRVYDDVAGHLLTWAEKTLLAHLIKLEKEALAKRRGNRGGANPTRAVEQTHGMGGDGMGNDYMDRAGMSRAGMTDRAEMMNRANLTHGERVEYWSLS